MKRFVKQFYSSCLNGNYEEQINKFADENNLVIVSLTGKDGDGVLVCFEKDDAEIVRCKDCTEWDDEVKECSHWYGFYENDFCSYGGRKDE